MDTNELRNLQEAYLEVYENQQVSEADSLAAMAARREKRLARQRKQMGVSSTGQDFGHDYGITAAERKKRQDAEFDKFIGRDKKGKDKTKKEEVSIYDIVLSHLLDEGYAKTVKQAEGIMLNMSEEWRQSIVEQEGVKAYAVDGHGNKYRDYANDGLSDRQKRRKDFANKRAALLVKGV